MLRNRTLVVALILAFVTLGQVHGADVLEQVPRDALGLVVVRNLAETDAKAGQVLAAFGSRLPGPLALLKSIAGVQAGLDERRDLMLVLLPSPDETSDFNLALWLPVADYNALVHSLDGDPGRRIAAVTLAGEDLLIARKQGWAVIMDPDQRDRLEQLGDALSSSPLGVNDWAEWVAANDAAVVVLPAGMKALHAVAEREKLFEPLPTVNPVPANQNLFAPANRPAPPPNGWPAIRHWIRSTLADRPELTRWTAEVEGAACGFRLDRDGNATLSLKLDVAEDALPATTTRAAAASGPAPLLFSSGDFVVAGGGAVSPAWVVPAVAPYVRQVANDLTNNYGIPVDEKDVAKFRAGIEQAIAEVRAFAVLTRPGGGDEAVFTNNFLALRVQDAQKFLTVAADCVAIWNQMLGNPQAAMKLVFQAQEVAINGHTGAEYSIDMAAAVNAPAIPEARASMEKLFGPGAHFRLQIVAIDDSTVLLAAATVAQVTDIIQGMKTAPDDAVEPAELLEAAKLLPGRSAWQLFVSPHGYTTWLKRQMDAVLGPVIGGPIVPDFPRSAPVGVAGGVDGQIIWIEVAAPIETTRGLSRYWHQ